MIEAVLWDFGGVILSSPFEAFNDYEATVGLPRDFIRTVNSTNPDANAWALLERSDISPAEFDDRFASESAELGHRVRGADVLSLLAGSIRPEMVRALDGVIAAGFATACLTNNVRDERARPEVDIVMERFDHVIESSEIGVRKPEMRFYQVACQTLGVEPSACVFLDDLGINLKPARAMGMTTIKVLDAHGAIAQLESALGIALR